MGGDQRPKLTRKALPELRSIGIEAAVPSEERAGQWVFFLHHFLVNDFLIAASRLVNADPALGWRRMLHDRELQGTQPYLLVDGVRRRCVPDGFVHFTYGGEEIPIALEVDRDTEKQFQWKLKIRKLLAWVEGPYTTFAGTNQLTIAVVVQGRTPERSAERLAFLLAWTRQELILRGKTAYGQLFLFSTTTPTTLSPHEYFFTAHWQTPFEPASRYALIEP